MRIRLLSPRARLAVWAGAASVLVVGQLLWIVLLRGPLLFARMNLLIGGQAGLGAVVLLIALLLRTTPPDARKLSRRSSQRLILLGALVLQLAAVLLLSPGLSEDVLRYRVDGRMLLARQSPYATAPIDFAGTDAVDSLVPFPDMRTIYAAAAEATFALAAAAERAMGAAPRTVPVAPPGEPSPWRWYLGHAPSPYRATVFRATFAAAFLIGTIAALRLLRVLDCSAWWAVLLAWNPLATLEVGGMGHADAVGVAFIVLALLALARSRWVTAGAMVALAAAVKPLGAVLLPFALRAAHDRQARAGAMRAAATFALLAALLYVPPLLVQGGYSGWRETARTYSQSWEANGSAYEIVTRAFGRGDGGRAMARAKEMARLLAAAAVLATALLAWQARASAATAGYALCLATLLVSPVVYPWYALWPLAFVPFLGGRAGWAALVWSATLPVSYLLWQRADWRLSGPVLWIEYAPVYAAAALEIAVAVRATKKGDTSVAPTAPAVAPTAPAGPAATASCR